MKLAQDIILKPIITEKTMSFVGEGQEIKKYVFKVAKDATKPEIAKAVEELFEGTKVAAVNTVIVKKKPKRMGVHAGYTSEWKKAYVTLAKGSKTIPFFDDLL